MAALVFFLLSHQRLDLFFKQTADRSGALCSQNFGLLYCPRAEADCHIPLLYLTHSNLSHVINVYHVLYVLRNAPQKYALGKSRGVGEPTRSFLIADYTCRTLNLSSVPVPKASVRPTTSLSRSRLLPLEPPAQCGASRTCECRLR